uniref:Uncharacterized protein n=1 Tax=viral metagenome TaxID=1070528 RepID=A0A6C0JG35_9ZZZZ
MVHNYCSPNNRNNSHTCFSNNSLKKIANEYNKRTKKTKIKVPKTLNDASRKTLWTTIEKKMQQFIDKSCQGQHCLLDTQLVKNIDDSELEESFRPQMPKEWKDKPTTWLSTVDIKKVMKQYEKNSDFVFAGAVPIDFDYDFGGLGQCVSNELCNLNIEELIKKNKYQFGVVFNLDPHYKSGSHWTSLYANFRTGGIYYFDSYANQPPEEVMILMERIKSQGNLLLKQNKLDINEMPDLYTQFSEYSRISKRKIVVDNPEDFHIDTLVSFGSIDNQNRVNIDKLTFNKIKNINGNELTLQNNIECSDCPYIFMKSFRTFYNNNRFQFKNSECGVYSMHFIEEFLNGKTFDQIINNIIKDDEINKKRNYFYRPY